MHHKKISSFADYLTHSPKSFSEITQFLVMNIFEHEKLVCLYLGELTETGVICHSGSFGWTKAESDNFKDVPIQSKFPFTDAMKSNRIMVFENNEAFFTEYPLMLNGLYKGTWESGLAIPIYPSAVMTCYSSIKIELDESAKVFLTAISSLLTLYMSTLPDKLSEEANIVKAKIDLPSIPLTNRQLVVAGMLERGFTNAEIGIEIGYSESLVRQETVAIYQKLKVTGRQAMQAIRALNLDGHDSGNKSI
jgi:DNA-binding CsgD family transcriptional regulator